VDDVYLVDFKIYHDDEKPPEPEQPKKTGRQKYPYNGVRNTSINRKDTIYSTALYTHHDYTMDAAPIQRLLDYRYRSGSGGLRIVYKMNCGYVGYRSPAIGHLMDIHGYSKEEAQDALRVRNVVKHPAYTILLRKPGEYHRDVILAYLKAQGVET